MRTNPVENILAKVKHTLISPRKISKYLGFADLSKIKDPIDREFMVRLLNKHSILEDLRNQVLSFKTLLLGNDDSLLEDWMQRTLNIGKSQLKTFIKGLKSDIDAVRNAIITNWSNGQVEGQVNRLKSIKRQMYGKAGFELLRRKVVLSRVG
jgi:transposase